jgi:serine/threonine protein kinase
MELSGLIEGRFKLLGHLGKDEIGATFLVEDQNSGKQVALRKLRTSIVFDDNLNDSLLEGFERARSLLHPHICAIDEFLKQEDSHAVLIVMEYVPGETLRDFLFKQPNYRCDEAAFLGLAGQILSAMEHAHQAGVTHRDLTADNVMITTKGSVKVIDFGIDAIVKEANFKRWNNPIFLSTFYVSPEQIAGEDPSPLMDIYSLGCLFYEMLAGQSPFSEKDIVNRLPDDRAEPIPGVSEGLNNLILKCLNSDKSQRPGSVEEMQSVLADHESPTTPPPEAASAETPSRAPSLSPEVMMEGEPEEKLSVKEPAHGDVVQEARALAQEILGEEKQEIAPLEPASSAPELAPPELALPEVVPKVFGDEEVSSEERVSDEEWVPDDDLPFAILKKKESSRRVVLMGGLLLLFAAAFWWYQSDLPAGSPSIGVTEEPAVVGDLPGGVPEEPPQKPPAEPAESPSRTPNRVVQAPDEENGIEDPTEQAGRGDSDAGGPRPSGTSPSNGFTIQVGAFGTEVAARRVLMQLSDKRYSGRIVPPGAGANGLFRVLVGGFSSKNEASQFQTRLKADGFPTLIKPTSSR